MPAGGTKVSLRFVVCMNKILADFVNRVYY